MKIHDAVLNNISVSTVNEKLHSFISDVLILFIVYFIQPQNCAQ